VIDGGQKGSVVTLDGTERPECVLSGFVIQNGSLGVNEGSGGGIRGSLTVEEWPIGDRTLASISHCVVRNNRSFGAGGIACCRGTITDCVICNNGTNGDWCEGDGIGGGLAHCDGTIERCRVSNNTGLWGGGGLAYCDGEILSCEITGNGAVCCGGGLYACSGLIANCIIMDNFTAQEPAEGDWGGGGLSSCRGDIQSCTICFNTTAGYGGGLHDCAGISDCIIWGNTPYQMYCYGAAALYSCIQDWTGGGEGNTSDDPLFVSGPLGDYYLSCRAAGQAADSPCIDRGSGTAESLGLDKLTTRTDGVPDLGVVDMGYHYPLPGGGLRIGCSLNQDEFQPGQLLVASVDAENEGPDAVVDVYLGFILPDRSMLCFTTIGFEGGLVPWLVSITLPQGFHYGPAEVFRLLIPESAGPGDYLLGCAFANPGKSASVGDVSLFPFTISSK